MVKPTRSDFVILEDWRLFSLNQNITSLKISISYPPILCFWGLDLRVLRVLFRMKIQWHHWSQWRILFLQTTIVCIFYEIYHPIPSPQSMGRWDECQGINGEIFELHRIQLVTPTEHRLPPLPKKKSDVEPEHGTPFFWGDSELGNHSRGGDSCSRGRLIQSFRAQLRLISLFLLSLYLSVGAE